MQNTDDIPALPLRCWPTSMARLSRVNTPRIVKGRNRRPSCQLVAHEIQTPHLVGCGGPKAFASMQRAPTLPSWLVPQRQAFFPVQAIHQLLAPLPAFAGSAAPGSCDNRIGLGSAQSLGGAAAKLSSVPAGSPNGRSTPQSAPHGTHAARCSGRPGGISSISTEC
jgi:hypothetical protein